MEVPLTNAMPRRCANTKRGGRQRKVPPMSTTNVTISPSLHTCTGYRVPRTVDAGWLSENQYHMHDALAVFAHEVPTVDPATIRRVLVAVRDGDAVVALYEHDGTTSARA